MCPSKSWTLASLCASALSWVNALVAQIPPATNDAGVPFSGSHVVNAALLATGISTVGAALVGTYKGFRAAQIELAQRWMQSEPGKFQAQIQELKGIAEQSQKRTEDANAKLHGLTADASAREMIHHMEMETLKGQLQIALDQLKAATEELHAARMDNNRMAAELHGARAEILRLMAQQGERLAAGQQEILDEVKAASAAAADAVVEAKAEAKAAGEARS